MLISMGAKEDVEGRVLLPNSLVEDAIARAPSVVEWFDQTGTREYPLEINRVYFGPGSDSLYVVDRDSKEIRRSRLSDVIDNVRLVEALPEFDFMMSMGLPEDVPDDRIYSSVFREMLLHSTKPVIAASTCRADLEVVHRMAVLVAGSESAFREKPFVVAYVEPESPLRFEDDIVERMWFCGEKGIPTTGASSSNLGGGGPITREGGLAQGIAESLAALVLLQCRHPGAGFVFGANTWATDMRSAVVCYGSPECATLTAAYADVGRFYGLPSWGGAGCTDAHALDAQAGSEAFQSVLMAQQCGATLAHDVGFLASGSLYDARFLVLTEEMIARVRQMWRPLDPTEENLALRAIDEVARASIRGEGPTVFLKHPHTAKHLRESLYLPARFVERRSLDPSCPTDSLLDRLDREVEELLARPRTPALPRALSEELRTRFP